MGWPWQEFNWGVFWAVLAALLVSALIRFIHAFLLAVFAEPDDIKSIAVVPPRTSRVLQGICHRK
jgi:NhaP-type Na+/H+ or K+/H+ antiporter